MKNSTTKAMASLVGNERRSSWKMAPSVVVAVAIGDQGITMNWTVGKHIARYGGREGLVLANGLARQS